MPGLAFPWSSKIKAVGLIWGNSSMVERSGFNSRFFRYIFLTCRVRIYPIFRYLVPPDALSMLRCVPKSLGYLLVAHLLSAGSA